MRITECRAARRFAAIVPAIAIVALVGSFAVRGLASDLEGDILSFELPAATTPPAATSSTDEVVRAQFEVGQARAAVEQARVASDTARARLDDFVHHYFRTQPAVEFVSLPQWRPGQSPRLSENPDLAALELELQSLELKRRQLLERFTPAHPEVQGTEMRIAALNEHLTQNGVVHIPIDPAKSARENKSQREAQGEFIAAAEQLQDRANQITSRQQEAVRRYEGLWVEWQEAQRELHDQVQREGEAIGRLALLQQGDEASETSSFAAPEMAIAVNTYEPTSDPADSSNSQGVALAALVLALVVAAWAAVRLARSTADVQFTSIEDVEAALALPVVGVLPAAGKPAKSRARFSVGSAFVLAMQVLVAVVVFALVSYGVQNAGLH